MIVYDELELKKYFVENLSVFSSVENIAVIIIDPYYGGRKKDHEERINAFLDFIIRLFHQPKIIWFYDSKKWPPMKSENVISIDLFKHGISVHDRFLFLFDGNVKRYVGHFHLGGSINAFYIDGEGTISIMRLSTLSSNEIREIKPLIKNLEKAYSNKTNKTNWGC